MQMKRCKRIGLTLSTNIIRQDGIVHPANIFTLIFLISFSAYPQSQNNIWCFGDSSGIDFDNALNPIAFVSSGHSRQPLSGILV